MTDKQIIIDDIDVSGCAYFYNNECRCLLDCVNHYENTPIQELFNRDTGIHTDCVTSPNCYYKQLKYIEKAFDYRENTYITNLNNLVNEAKFLRTKLQSKEQESERLKDEIFHLRKEGKKSCAYCADLIAKEQECERLKEEIINRNKKIEELRFSVSDLTNRLCDLNAEKSFRIVDLEQALQEIKEIVSGDYEMLDPRAKQKILQKISECEEK